MISFKGSQAAADADSNYPVAPEGTIAYLTCVEAAESMSKGNPEKNTPPRPMLNLELVVSHGEYADKIRVWDWLVFIEAGGKGHGMTLHALHAFGFKTEGENDYRAQDFVGRGVKAELGVETYRGKRKNNIARYLVDEEETPPATPAETQPEEEKEPAWVGEGTRAGAAKTAAARTPPAPSPAAAKPAARKLPWGKKK